MVRIKKGLALFFHIKKRYRNTIENEILFLTPSLGTKWVYYQQHLIKKAFPNSKRIIINGKYRWDFNLQTDCVWYDFIKIALQFKSRYKYFIHIDEDCFLIDSKGIYDAIELMEANKYSLIGPPDGVYEFRQGNPFALNSFFMVGRIDHLEKVWSNYNIGLTFSDLNLPNPLGKANVHFEAEHYYDFFCNFYANQFKLGFLIPTFEDRFKSTNLKVEESKSTFCIHLWYTRDWNESFLVHGMENKNRYRALEIFLEENKLAPKWNLLSKLDIWLHTHAI